MTNTRRYGFSLIEIAVVLLIVSLLVFGFLILLMAGTQQAQYNTTVATMDAIDRMLLYYSVAQKRIPCPARLQSPPTDPNYGVEAANPGSCTGGTPAADFLSSSGVAEGAVPTRTLRMPDSYMYDAWGRRIRYAVDPAATVATVANLYFPPPMGGLCSPSTSSITMQGLGVSRSASAIYALVSHGANGHGGYTLNGSVFNGKSVNAAEQTNCHCNSTGAATGNNGVYVQKALSLDPANANDGFDDIVDFRELWQMHSDIYPAREPACLYVLDSGNNRIEKYVFSTSSWTTMSDSFSSPTGLSVDGGGNVWVADGGFLFNSVKEYNNASKSWSTVKSGLALLSNLYVDSSGNIWMALPILSTVLEYNNPLTNLLNTLLHSLNSPSGLYVDVGSNLWLCDSGNNRILKFDGSAWLSIGISGTAPGQFNDPKGVYVDTGGNIWVADSGNNRVQMYNGSVWSVYGGPSPGVSAGHFYEPNSISGDAYGHIWVTDTGNNRIEEYSNGSWGVFATYAASGSAFSAPNVIVAVR